MDTKVQPMPEAQPVRRMVPVMAEGVAVPSGGGTSGEGPTATSSTNPAAPAATLAPVATLAPAATLAPVATLAPAATLEPAAPPRSDPRVVDLPKSDPEPAVTAAAHEVRAAVAVCPFLGFKNDPSTRCDFADPRNFCHAASGRGGAPTASPRRFITGKAGSARSREIGAAHQNSVCLTTAHQQCERYPAPQAVT